MYSHVLTVIQAQATNQVFFLRQVAQRNPLLFGDYRTALTPEHPRVYEDIQDYQAAKGLFDEVSGKAKCI